MTHALYIPDDMRSPSESVSLQLISVPSNGIEIMVSPSIVAIIRRPCGELLCISLSVNDMLSASVAVRSAVKAHCGSGVPIVNERRADVSLLQ